MKKEHIEPQTHLHNRIKLLEKRLNSPKTDLAETDETIIVRMELPVDSFSWDIKENTILYVLLEKKSEFFSNEKIIYTEANYGKTIRRVKLPCKVGDSISESWVNGVWFIVFKKLDIPRRIEIEPENFSKNLNLKENKTQDIPEKKINLEIDNSKEWLFEKMSDEEWESKTY